MRCRLGQRVDRDVATVMASRAVGDCYRPRRAGVTHRGRPECVVVVMAGGTLRGGRNMGGRLAQGSHSIVTGRTLADRAGIMSIGGGGPGHCRFVAGIALRCGTDVGSRLDLGIQRQVSPGVAGRTAISRKRSVRSGMVHFGWSEGVVVGVANIARSAGRQMGRRLAEGCRPVVTACASAGHDALVRIAGRLPGNGGVAGIAGLRGLDMRRRLGLCIDGDIGPAMARSAITGGHRAAGAAMVHQPRSEGDETGVTGIALGRRGDVVGRFAEGIGAVMATGAATGDRRGRRSVVESGSRPGGRGAVTGVALGCGRDMGC